MKQIKTEYEYDRLNRLQKIKSKNEEILGYEIKDEVTISYDCRGNMTLIKSSKGENIGEFIYDAKNKLIRTTTHKNIIADYCYNGIGQRVKKEIDGKIYEYVLDITSEFNDILEVKTSSNANPNTNEESEKYIYGVKYPVGSKLIGTTKGRELESIYMNDELGSVIRVINLNKEIEVGNEQRKALIEYNTFGKEREYKNRNTGFTSKISIIKSFTGYEEDKETGLDFVQARYYMKDIGRFVEEDTNKGEIHNQASLNWYIHCYNNPLSYVDLDGNIPVYLGDIIRDINNAEISWDDKNKMAIVTIKGGLINGDKKYIFKEGSEDVYIITANGFTNKKLKTDPVKIVNGKMVLDSDDIKKVLEIKFDEKKYQCIPCAKKQGEPIEDIISATFGNNTTETIEEAIFKECDSCEIKNCLNRGVYQKPFELYQSAKLPGKEKDGSMAEDMKCGKVSYDELRNMYGKIAGIDITAIESDPDKLNMYLEKAKDYVKDPYTFQLNFENRNLQWDRNFLKILEVAEWLKEIDNNDSDALFREFKTLVNLTSRFDLNKAAKELIEHFKEGTGTDFRNKDITDAVIKHDSTQKYVNDFLDILIKTLKDQKFNLEAVHENKDFKEVTTDKLERPKFNKMPEDIIEGLTVIADDTHGMRVVITNYMYCEKFNKYSGILEFDIYDHFGLDPADILDKIYGKFPWFRAWFALQHYNGFKEEFKPFITRFDVNYAFNSEETKFDKGRLTRKY